VKPPEDILNIEAALKAVLLRVENYRKKVVPDIAEKKRKLTLKQSGAAKAAATLQRRKERILKQVSKSQL